MKRFYFSPLLWENVDDLFRCHCICDQLLTVQLAFRRLDPTVEELTEIKTAVSEAVSNSVIHGYSGWEDRSQAMVELECEINGNGRVTIIVSDHGRGIANVEKAMQPLFSTVESEERSGMGFTVMESFMDKLQVKSEEGKGTAVTMTKYLDLVSAL